MIDQIQKKYSDIESIKGKRLLKLLTVVFIIFIVIGVAIGYVSSRTLKQNESLSAVEETVPTESYVTLKGLVTFLGDNKYSSEQVEYVLTDSKGKEMILLRSGDDKLSIAEGLLVTVTGKKIKTKDGKTDLLQVTEVTLNSGSKE